MDAFRTLMGGARFDKKRFNQDVQVFEPKKPVASTSTSLPSELDFFGTDQPAADEAVDRATAKKNRKRKRAEDAAAAAEAAGIDYPALLRQHRIKLTGLEPPNPVASFAELTSSHNCPQLIADNWSKMGMKAPTGIQMASWGIMLEKRDVLACAPTGSGKTLSFILPLLVLNPPNTTASAAIRPTSIIIEPTRELAMQVLRETSKLGAGGGWNIKVLGEDERAAKSGEPKKRKGRKGKRTKKPKTERKDKKAGSDDDEESESEEEVEEKEKPEEQEDEPVGEKEAAAEPSTPTDILITTPLRLIYAIKAGTVDPTNVRHLILDEADKLFELNFVEQTDEIIAACTHPDLRKGMFSATMPSSVEEMAKSVMSGGGIGAIRAIVGHKDAATETIKQSLQFVGTEDHKLLSLRTLIGEGKFTPPVLIFVQSIQRAKELSTELLFDGINADAIHAERTPEERDEVVRGFAEGKIWCLISTDVMGRGVDFKGVKLVINYDFPQSPGSYIHRIGRTGRAGKEGRAITFFTKADAVHLKSIVNVMRASGCDVPQWMVDLKPPTQDEKKKLRMKPIARKDISRTNGAGNGDKADRKRVKRDRVMGGKSAFKAKKVKVDKEVKMDE
ncbi:P-loop containing nucleoside triphosphate hydrolase protein [Leucosporidium creatinivorum]|uniref:RNA helicase n=1 Tax=Leucosporidium creatinivorum TaxID=106004 RepID=A0A1Y2DCE8_9BASI|nr:P-loop containing nucleoside triphosphate hydrolase protein [Leucosporidium creatinivorum]